MKKTKSYLSIGITLILLSSWPLFLIVREQITQSIIMDRYTISHADTSQGFATSLDAQYLYVEGISIKIEEIPTGQTAPITNHDVIENVPPGDIVKLQWHVNGKPVSTADEIWLSNRDKGARYYSWADVLLVEGSTKKLALVQRLTHDETPMNERAWKIIWVDLDGNVSEEKVTYNERSKNLLAVQILEMSGTTLMSIGFYSDIRYVYPSLLFPIFYPVITILLGLLFLLIGAFLHFGRIGRGNTIDPLPSAKE